MRPSCRFCRWLSWVIGSLAYAPWVWFWLNVAVPLREMETGDAATTMVFGAAAALAGLLCASVAVAIAVAALRADLARRRRVLAWLEPALLGVPLYVALTLLAKALL